MTRSVPPDAASPLPQLTVLGLRFLGLADIAEVAGNETAAGHLIELAYAAFDGWASNVVPLPRPKLCAATDAGLTLKP